MLELLAINYVVITRTCITNKYEINSARSGEILSEVEEMVIYTYHSKYFRIIGTYTYQSKLFRNNVNILLISSTVL